MRVGVRKGPGERLLQYVGEALPQPAVVAIARHIDEAADKTLQRVAADEQRDTLTLLQVEDAGRDVEQLGLPDLEQEVAREGVEDVLQRLAVMAVRRQPGAGD